MGYEERELTKVVLQKVQENGKKIDTLLAALQDDTEEPKPKAKKEKEEE